MRARRISDGLIIVFSGVDGSGKSSQVAAVETALCSSRVPVQRRWFRPGYSHRVESIRRLLRRTGQLTVMPGSSPERDRLLARPGVSTTWLCMAIIDSAIEFAVISRLARRRGGVVLYDRWLIDALIDLDLAFEHHHRLRALAHGLLPRICARPHHSYLLVLSADEASERLRRKGEDDSESADVAVRQHLAYTLFAASPSSSNYTIIDALSPSTASTALAVAAITGTLSDA